MQKYTAGMQGYHLIAGERYADIVEIQYPNINPSTCQNLGYIPYASQNTVRVAVSNASLAFKSWKNTSRVKRSDYFYNLCKLIEKNQSHLAEVISLETGKSLNESNAEVIETLHMCQWVAGSGRSACGDWMASEIAAKDAYVMRKPKGVVAVISPWNFPLAIGSMWTTGPALVEGNTVVHKPSELTPFTAQLFASLYKEAGFPEGVYNLVHGAAKTGEDLVQSPLVKTILFTGSAEVGRKIRKFCATRYDRNCSIETGSKSATMVFEDGLYDLALEVSLASAFKLSGQRCVSSSRILVEKSICTQFVADFVKRAKNLGVGDPFERPAPYFGPLISEEQLKKVESFNNWTRNWDYFDVVLDGSRIDRPGYYLSPHVYVANWDTKMTGIRNKILRNEVFGPHVAIIPFENVEKAVQIYNDTEYGLALGVVTDDFRKMKYVRDNANYGMIYMNGGSVAAESHLPFGGIGKSGNGYKTAAGTYRAVTDEVAVTVNHEQGITWAQGMK